jgi:hypothetical protein
LPELPKSPRQANSPTLKKSGRSANCPTEGRSIPKTLINSGVRDGDGYRPVNENGLAENLLSFSSEGLGKDLKDPEVKKIVAV